MPAFLLKSLKPPLLALAIVLLASLMALVPTEAGEGEWVEVQATDHWPPGFGQNAVVFNDKMWVLGGGDVWSSSDGKHWTLVVESAEWGPRIDYSSIVFKDKMWVMGGRVESGVSSNEVWNSVDGLEWEMATASAQWSPRFGHTSVVFDGKMWVICGVTFDGNPDRLPTDVWCSEDGVNWEETIFQINPNIIGLRGHASVVFGDKIWVLGGEDYTATTRSGSVYSSTDGVQWDGPIGMGFFGSADFPAVVYDDKMWILGGFFGGAAGTAQNTIWTSVDGLVWPEVEANPKWSERYRHSAVVFDDKIWVMGGQDRNDVWYFPSAVFPTRSDINEDGVVDSTDLLIFLKDWGKATGP